MVLTVQHLGTKCEPSAPPEKLMPYTARHRHLGYTGNMRPTFTIHKQVHLTDLDLYVDEHLAEIIPWLNQHGIPTVASCQGSRPGDWMRTPNGNPGYVLVRDEQGMERLAELAQRVPWAKFEITELKEGTPSATLRWEWNDLDRTLAGIMGT